MKLLVVDDEPLAQQRLVQMLTEFEPVETVFTANNGLEAIEQCKINSPDLVLLDIRMPGMDGLEAAQYINQLASPPVIIFTTAFDQHALDAFKVHAFDYLLKPVRQEKLRQVIERVSQFNRVQLASVNKPQDVRKTISSKISGSIKLIPVDDIIYFLAEQKYVTVKHLKGETIIEETLKELEKEFSQKFIRVHRNALVAKKFISGVRKNTQGQSFITLQNDDRELEISRRHLGGVKQEIVHL